MAAALTISTADEGSVGAHLPNLLTSRATSFSSADQDGKRRTPVCSAIELPEELEGEGLCAMSRTRTINGDGASGVRDAGLCVRNTFINTSARRSPSLEGFYRERGAVTCPSGRIGVLQGLFCEGRPASPPVPEVAAGVPDTPCHVETPSYLNTVRTPCAVDAPLERAWHPMDSYAVMEAWNQHDLTAYMAQGPPCVDAQQYYVGLQPQVHVESVAVSAVGHLAGEAQAQSQAQPAAAKERTVVKLADSLALPMSPTPMLAPADVGKLAADRTASSSILEGLGVACGHAGARSGQPAEGYISEGSWSCVPAPAAPSQPSSWATQPSYCGLIEGGVPLYSAPALPPMLPADVETWSTGMEMPAPLQSPGGVPLAAPVTPSPPSRPALGTDELPSIGSQAHALGTCKPCAFLHTKGCENGLSCQFCHLCENGEKKRRRKAKLESQRQVRKSKQASLTPRGPPSSD